MQFKQGDRVRHPNRTDGGTVKHADAKIVRIKWDDAATYTEWPRAVAERELEIVPKASE